MLEKDYILFEDYLSGNLELDQEAAFESRLQNDVVFNETFSTYKQASQYLKNYFENEDSSKVFISNLETVSSKYFEKEVLSGKSFKGINPWYYSIAAAAILVVGFFVTQQLSIPAYANYANYGTISLTVRGSENQILNKAESAFNTHNYKEADIFISQLLKADTNNIELQLYKAVSLVELNKYNEADLLFENIIQTPSAYKNKAIYYLALSKLKQNDNRTCLKILRTLPEDAEDYKQAQQLIRKLK